MDVLAIIGVLVGVIGISFAIYYGNKPSKVHEDSIKRIVEEIKSIKPHDAPESLIKEIRIAAERITNPKTAPEHLLKGLAAEIDVNYEKALRHYQNAIQLNPKYADAFLNMGRLYCEIGDYDNAIQSLHNAIQLKPNNADAYNFMGSAYYFKRKNDEAIQSFQNAIQLKPNFVQAYCGIGLTYNDAGKYKEAIQSFQKVIDLNPDNANGYSAIAYDSMGLVFQKLGNQDKAKECFQKYEMLKRK